MRSQRPMPSYGSIPRRSCWPNSSAIPKQRRHLWQCSHAKLCTCVLRTRLEQRNIHSARDRVLHYLTLNAGEDRRTVMVPGTLKDLAAELGLTHEALYRTLADLATAGEIERFKGKIRLAKLRV